VKVVEAEVVLVILLLSQIMVYQEQPTQEVVAVVWVLVILVELVVPVVKVLWRLNISFKTNF
jgi:hypothetical protein